MSGPQEVQVPARLLDGGVSIVGIGVMGAAYTARLSSLGVPVTIFNRTRSKAEEMGRAHTNVAVAPSMEECARASDILLVASSPTTEAISSICNRLVDGGLAQDKHVVFIVDCGLAQARTMDEVLFEKGDAASLTNVSMFGGAANAMDGSGLMNASGRTRAEESLTHLVMPLLGLFATVTYHPGGPETAALFATAGHIGCMPLFFGFLHYVALMRNAGVDSDVAYDFFLTLNRAMLDLYVPFVHSALTSNDDSTYLGSHELMRDIMDAASETCGILNVDRRLADLMSEYHQRAMSDPELAATSYHCLYKLIDPSSA